MNLQTLKFRVYKSSHYAGKSESLTERNDDTTSSSVSI